MALLNPNFEEPGVNAGDAASWDLVASTSVERVAAFGEPPRAQEGFEGWFEHLSSLEAITVAMAIYDARGEGVEDFEEGWMGGPWQARMPASLLSALGTGAFGAGLTHLESWASARTSAALSEGFEAGWGGNEGFAWELASSGAPLEEVFDGAWPVAWTL